MHLSRREFSKALLAVTVLASAAWEVACNIVDEILAYASAGFTAFTGVVNLLSGEGLISPAAGQAATAVGSLIQKAFSDIRTAEQDYQTNLKATGVADPTLKQKVVAALQVAEQDIQSFWTGLNLPGGKAVQTAQGLLEIILSTLAGFGISLGAPAPSSALTARAATAGLPSLSVVPKKRSMSQFKRDFNHLLKANGYQKYALS